MGALFGWQVVGIALYTLRIDCHHAICVLQKALLLSNFTHRFVRHRWFVVASASASDQLLSYATLQSRIYKRSQSIRCRLP